MVSVMMKVTMKTVIMMVVIAVVFVLPKTIVPNVLVSVEVLTFMHLTALLMFKSETVSATMKLIKKTVTMMVEIVVHPIFRKIIVLNVHAMVSMTLFMRQFKSLTLSAGTPSRYTCTHYV